MKTALSIPVIAFCLALFVLSLAPGRAADNTFTTPGGAAADGKVIMCVNGSGQAVPCGNATTPLQISGSFSATLSGFTPNGNFASLTATNASASTALPSGTTVSFQNAGTTTVSCTLGIGSAAATTNEIQIPASSTVFMTVGSNTFGACIDQSGSTSNVVVLAGGSGLGTGFGGGGSGGSGSNASVSSTGSSVPGSATYFGMLVSGNLVGVPGTAFGLLTDESTSSQFHTDLNQLHTDLGTLNTTAAGPIAAGTNIIGKTGIDQSTDGTTNGVRQTSQYPSGATAVQGSTTGTTAATSTTLAATASVTNYVCGFSIRANATAAATGNATLSDGTKTFNYTQWTAPNANGLGVTEEIFSPCYPASAANTAWTLTSAAPGTGGVVSVAIWGYQK